LQEDPAKRLTVSQLKERLTALQDPETLKAKGLTADPKMAALIASYQPPPGVGMTAVPVVPAGMAIRRRMSTREILWNWRFTMLKWGSAVVVLLMVAAMIAAIFWNPGAPHINHKNPVLASGQLLLLDKPIANATIRLIPEGFESNVRPYAKTDSNGMFSFTTAQPGDGAPPGRYKVVIEKEPELDRNRLMPNVSESDPFYRALIGSPLMLETDVHRNYSSERDTKLKLILEPEGNRNIKLVLNYLGN
ncbi:MAG TPA: carboxypeptidase-like regulatory domain-containing protein, partial [Gemmatales bacterium]|nr:carboxypeptidase-like regulatory domain-containing protein [Gemmatales bacterium]